MPAADITWHDAPPAVAGYLALRAAAGLSAFPPPAAERGLAGTWQATCVHDAGPLVGLGRAIMRRLVEAIADRAPDGVFVSLLADPPGVRLYESFGFRASAPASVGMFRRFAQVPGEHP